MTTVSNRVQISAPSDPHPVKSAAPQEPVPVVRQLVDCVVEKDGQFWFYLNRRLVAEAMRSRQLNASLKFPPPLLASLRRAAIWDIGATLKSDQFDQATIQSGLTFCTHFDNRLVFRTVVSLDGDVLNQIESRFLDTPDECLLVNTVHHWLMQQLTDQLRSDIRQLLGGLAWTIAIAPPVLTAAASANHLNEVTIPVICAQLGLMVPLKRWSQKRLKRSLPNIIRFVFSRLLSPNPVTQWISRRVVSKMG